VNQPFALYVVCERGVFASDAAWLAALARLSQLLVPGEGLQVRAKSVPAREADELFAKARRATAAARIPVLLNGSRKQAARLGFEGAHLPEAELLALTPERSDICAITGASVHSSEARRLAEAAGVDFVLAGPVFDPVSKPGRGEGIELLAAIACEATVPVLAIGGIRPARVAECLGAGARGVGVVSGIVAQPGLDAALESYRAALAHARSATAAQRSIR
jgi:thiamine-phosphate diphosphorylase